MLPAGQLVHVVIEQPLLQHGCFGKHRLPMLDAAAAQEVIPGKEIPPEGNAEEHAPVVAMVHPATAAMSQHAYGLSLDEEDENELEELEELDAVVLVEDSDPTKLAAEPTEPAHTPPVHTPLQHGGNALEIELSGMQQVTNPAGHASPALPQRPGH